MNGRVTAQLIDGRATAARVKDELRERVAALAARGIVPGLGTVLVGDDPGSHAYVRGKHKDSAEIGIASVRVDLPADSTQEQVEEAVAALNADAACTGFLVQLPLPAQIDADRVLELVDPDKDADGLHPTNLGRLVLNVNGPMRSPLPATPHAIVDLLLRHDVDLRGAEVCVIGRGVTVGRPLGPAADPPRRQRHGDAVPHRDEGRRRARPPRGRRRRGGRRAGDGDGGDGEARARPSSTSGSRGSTSRAGAPAGRRRRARRAGRRRTGRPRARRGGPDDTRDAADERGRGGRAGCSRTPLTGVVSWS